MTRRLSPRSLTTIATLVLTVCSSGCARRPAPASTPTSPVELRVFLVDRLATSQLFAGANAPRALRREIDDDLREAVSLRPPAGIRFDAIPDPPGSRLQLAVAVDPAGWRSGSDGASFTVRCRGPDGGSVVLLHQTVEHAGPWRDLSADLAPCGGPETVLELETGCGPAEDCRHDLALWGSPQVVLPETIAVRPARLVLLVSIDTLRPDRLGCYGATRPTSPALDALAAHAVLYEDASAPAPWTLPSHASLMTSVGPEVHGANQRRAVPPALPVLAEVLRDAGWQTAGFADVDWLGPAFGLDRGFDHYECRTDDRHGHGRRGVRRTADALLRWLARADERPAFVFWHVFDVHAPYGSASPHGGRFRRRVRAGSTSLPVSLLASPAHRHLGLERYASVEEVVASYDEGVAEVDEAVGGVLDVLRRAGRWDDTLVVVTADHGESLYDHGIWVGHGLFLDRAELRIPLLVKLPGSPRRACRVSTPVTLVDVAPTILAAEGVPTPATFRGVPLPTDEPTAAARREARILAAFAEDTGAVAIRRGRIAYVTEWGFAPSFSTRDELETLLRPPSPPPGFPERLNQASGRQLYDLTRDPGERHDLHGGGSPAVAELRALAETFRAALDQWRTRLPAAEVRLRDDRERLERLRALGYLREGD